MRAKGGPDSRFRPLSRPSNGVISARFRFPATGKRWRAPAWRPGRARSSGYIRVHVRFGGPARRSERRTAPGGGAPGRAAADPGRRRHREDRHAGGPRRLAAPSRACSPAGSCCSPSPAAPPTTCCPGPPPAPGRPTPSGSPAGTFHAIAHRIIRQHAESFSLPPRVHRHRPGGRRGPAGRAAGRITAWRAPQRRAPRAAVCADIYTRCVNTQHDGGRRGAPRLPLVRPSTPASSPSCSAGTSRTSAATAWSTSTTCCCCGGPRWPIPPPGRCCADMFDAVLVDEYQDVNAVQADIVRLLRPDGRVPDLRRRRRPGHLRLPRRRPGAPAPAGGHLPRPHRRAAGPELPVAAGGAAAGQRGPPAVGRARARAHRGPRGRGGPGAGPLPRRGDAGPRDLRPGP